MSESIYQVYDHARFLIDHAWRDGFQPECFLMRRMEWIKFDDARAFITASGWLPISKTGMGIILGLPVINFPLRSDYLIGLRVRTDEFPFQSPFACQ